MRHTVKQGDLVLPVSVRARPFPLSRIGPERTVADEIAPAFLTSRPSIGTTDLSGQEGPCTRADVLFVLPADGERLGAVLGVIDLIFNKGYGTTRGDVWLRPAAVRGRPPVRSSAGGLLDREPEVYGLLALMELQATRIRARIDPNGDPVLLADQDRRLWDRLLIRRGLDPAASGRGSGRRSVHHPGPDCGLPCPSPPQLGHRLATGRRALHRAGLPDPPVIDLNRPGGTFLRRLDRDAEAREEFERAAALTFNESGQRPYRKQALGS